VSIWEVLTFLGKGLLFTICRFCDKIKIGEKMEFDLLSELKKHKATCPEEEKNVQLTLEFLKGDNCYERSNLLGHITAGGFIIDNNGKVLLNHHKKTNMWFQFGGHSDGQTNCLEVARREIWEESGLDSLEILSNGICDVDVQEIAYSAKNNEPEHIHYDINFVFKTNETNFEMSNESEDIRWVTFNEARKLISAHDKGTQRLIDKCEQIYLKTKSL